MKDASTKKLIRTAIILFGIIILMIVVYVVNAKSSIIIGRITDNVFEQLLELKEIKDDVKNIAATGEISINSNMDEYKLLNDYKIGYDINSRLQNNETSIKVDLKKDSSVLIDLLLYYKNNTLYGKSSKLLDKMVILLTDVSDINPSKSLSEYDLENIYEILDKELNNSITRKHYKGQNGFTKIDGCNKLVHNTKIELDNYSLESIIKNIKNNLDDNTKFIQIMKKNNINYISLFDSIIEYIDDTDDFKITINLYNSILTGKLYKVEIKYGVNYTITTELKENDNNYVYSLNTNVTYTDIKSPKLSISRKETTDVYGVKEKNDFSINITKNDDDNYDFNFSYDLNGSLDKYKGAYKEKNDNKELSFKNDNTIITITEKNKENENNTTNDIEIAYVKYSDKLNISINNITTENSSSPNIDNKNAVFLQDIKDDQILINLKNALMSTPFNPIYHYFNGDTDETLTNMLHENPTALELNSAARSGNTIFVVFGRHTCSPCVHYHSAVEELSYLYQNLYFIDMADYKNEELKEIFNLDYEILPDMDTLRSTIKNGINTTPLTLIIKDGKTIESFYGAMSSDELLEFLINTEIK